MDTGLGLCAMELLLSWLSCHRHGQFTRIFRRPQLPYDIPYTQRKSVSVGAFIDHESHFSSPHIRCHRRNETQHLLLLCCAALRWQSFLPLWHGKLPMCCLQHDTGWDHHETKLFSGGWIGRPKPRPVGACVCVLRTPRICLGSQLGGCTKHWSW